MAWWGESYKFITNYVLGKWCIFIVCFSINWHLILNSSYTYLVNDMSHFLIFAAWENQLSFLDWQNEFFSSQSSFIILLPLKKIFFFSSQSDSNILLPFKRKRFYHGIAKNLIRIWHVRSHDPLKAFEMWKQLVGPLPIPLHILSSL